GYLLGFWNKEMAAYEKIDQGLALFNQHLISTVNGTMLAYLIKNEDSLYGIMKALKEEYTIPPRTLFAAMLQRQTQPPPEEKSTNEPYKGHREGNGCPSPCGQHPSWSKCYYLNPAIRPANVNENAQVRKEIDALIAANPRMAASVKSIQDRFKKRKEKEKPEEVSFNPPPPPVAPAAP